MDDTHARPEGYLLAALIGAAGGGLLVLLASRAIPNLMAGMMAGMMRKMISEIKESGGAADEM